jgi:retinol-binding protein 3
MNKLKLISFFLMLLVACELQAQGPELTEKEKSLVIDSASQLLVDHYIDLEVAEEMANTLHKYYKEGRYDSITDYKAFAAKLQSDLMPLINDKHFHVKYDPLTIAQSKKSGEDEALNKILKDKRINFGFREVEILDGNIGYLKLDRFPYPSDARDVMTGALSMLSNSNAIIIDLSENRGGYNESVQLLMSCFFRYPILINTLYERHTDETEQFWTYPYLYGKVLDSVGIYIITSRRTFSAGEWFAYSMQQNEKATIVGQVSKGGATPSEFYHINDHFMIMIPNKSCISPITNTNFNNVGVQPDVPANMKNALNQAYLLALENLDSLEADPSIKKEYAWIMDGLKPKLEPVVVNETILEDYAGNYGSSSVQYRDGQLFLKLHTGTEFSLVPINNQYFMLQDLDYYRIEFKVEAGKVTGLTGKYANGYQNFVAKNTH